jgi:ATP-dependent DNA helicase PIF1
MGGVLLLLTGDFRQTLPVVQGGTRADEINATLKSSVLWPHVKKLHLTKNMRAHLTGDVDAWDFSETLEDLGNGVIGKETNGVFKVPESVCVKNLNELMNSIYPNIEENYKDSDWLSERAILAPRNVEVNALNQSLLEKIPGNKKTYKSFDKVMIDTDASKYPIEFLNSLDPPGVPQHTLDLKVGCVVMLLRNLNPPKLCNGTRIQITSLHDHLIRGKILSGQHKGQDATIPRIPIIPTGYPFQFKRIQFPVKLSFVMTINKSQGQSIKHCGLYLENPCFSHGQFYVGASRVGAQKNLKIFAPENKTVNIVYQEVLGDL